MPNYYSGADPTQAFSGGLMAGYEFIDRIKARAEQVRLQKLAEERDSQRFEMQKEGFATQQKVAGLQIQDLEGDMQWEKEERADTRQQRPILRERERKEADARLRNQTLQGDAAQLQIDAAKDLKRGKQAEANLLDSIDFNSPPTLGQIGMRGAQGEVGEGTVLRPRATAQQSASAPQSTATTPPAPIDLRAAQRDQDAQPNFVERAFDSIKTSFAEGQKAAGRRDTSYAWQAIADTRVGGNSRVNSPRLTSVQIREARLNPERYAPAYVLDRNDVDPQFRPTLDATMLAATQEARDRAVAEMKKLDPTDPKNKAKFAALTNQQVQAARTYDDLTKAISKDVGNTVLPNGGTTSADDPNVLPAVTRAKQAQDAAGVLPRVTEQSLRLQQTQLGRMDNPARLNKQQLNWLSEAFRTGAMTPETYMNWRRYGGPLAPQPPKIIPFGAGKGVVLYANGQLAEIDFGGGKGGKGGKGGGSDGGASFGQSIELIKDTLNARIKRGDIPDAVEGTGIHEMGKMLLLLQRHGRQFQLQNPEIDLLDESGEMSMEWAKNPLQALKVMNWYVDALNGIDEPDETTDPIPDSEDVARIIPTTP